jgi:hypothetical protein
MSLWWIPRDRIRALSASDLAVLRMCRVLTLFMVAAIIYVVVIVSGVGVRADRDRLRHQADRCGSAEGGGATRMEKEVNQ